MREEDLGSLVKRVMGECEFLALAKGIAVHLQESPGSSTVQCDPEKIGRVVLNVLSHAIRFSSQGGNITIVLRPESLPCGRRKGDSGSKPGMAIIVVDEGVGIPEEELEAVFDKFLQSSKTKTGAGGTGLGLTICKEIVAAHGGRIWAQNRPEGGAVFTVILPLQQLRSPYPTKEISDARRPTEFASCR